MQTGRLDGVVGEWHRQLRCLDLGDGSRRDGLGIAPKADDVESHAQADHGNHCEQCGKDYGEHAFPMGERTFPIEDCGGDARARAVCLRRPVCEQAHVSPHLSARDCAFEQEWESAIHIRTPTCNAGESVQYFTIFDRQLQGARGLLWRYVRTLSGIDGRGAGAARRRAHDAMTTQSGAGRGRR